MSRRRGTTVELLDYAALSAACEAAGIHPPALTPHGLLRQAVSGRTVVLGTEGVGVTRQREGHTFLQTTSYEWESLPTEVVESCRTGEVVDLADHIRTFGSRLDVNHLLWREWALNEEDQIPTLGSA